MTKKKNFQTGFTLIELLIATTVFSVFLSLLAMVTLRVGRLYYKGILSSQTQEAARAISTDVGRSIQFSSSGVSSGAGYYCAGARRYSYVLGRQVNDISPTGTQTLHALVVDSLPCSGPSVMNAPIIAATQREMVPAHMRLADFSITPPNGTSGLFTVKVRIVYGDDDLLIGPASTTARCNGNNSGTEFCAVSELTTTVEKRL